jgi:hypothetical protein
LSKLAHLDCNHGGKAGHCQWSEGEGADCAEVVSSEHRLHSPNERRGERTQHYEITYRTCIAIFLLGLARVCIIPLKEYYLGSYVTEPFDEIRDEAAARKLNQLGVVTSGVHFYDTFERELFPLIDLDTKSELSRSTAGNLSLTDFLVRANLRRADLLTGLPQGLLAQPVDLMVDVLAPLCGPVTSTVKSWETPAQLLFGNWFPTIRHEFCRDFHDKFPRDRFFNHADKTPVDKNLSSVGDVTLGLIAVVNMSEVYLRHFKDALVVRKVMKNVQEGYIGLELPEYTYEVAEAIVNRYSTGISLADVVKLLPGSFDEEHIALVDVLGVTALLKHYLESQQLTMGVNVNGEAAILAEVTHAAASFFTSDFLINTVGMHLVSTMHLAPFWNCAIKHTTMDKAITVDDVDGAAIKQCGVDSPDIRRQLDVPVPEGRPGLHQDGQHYYVHVGASTRNYGWVHRVIHAGNADGVSFTGERRLSLDESPYSYRDDISGANALRISVYARLSGRCGLGDAAEWTERSKVPSLHGRWAGKLRSSRLAGNGAADFVPVVHNCERGALQKPRW